jgi:hypothetical protein
LLLLLLLLLLLQMTSSITKRMMLSLHDAVLQATTLLLLAVMSVWLKRVTSAVGAPSTSLAPGDHVGLLPAAAGLDLLLLV